MRGLSAAAIKQMARKGKPRAMQGYPGKETTLGQLLDQLGSVRGLPAYPTTADRKPAGHLQRLRDMWGMDIRHGVRVGEWILVGEWFGSSYTCYLGGIVVENCEPPSDGQVREFCAEWGDID